MASLGSLVVSLGLNAVEFTSGLSKADVTARRFGESLGRGITTAARAAGIGIAAIGVAAGAAGLAIDRLLKSAANFKDLEETTGANAEALASFAVSAATAGVEMDSVGSAINKLTKNLVGVDDESKAAGAALGALGLNVKDFKALDPAAQYEAVGKALGGFADGAGKTAVALALFGKAGAEQLKVFKALEEAGGRQTILTQRQIELADSYADAQAKAAAELRLYAQAAATEAVPAFTELTKAAILYVKELIGIDEKTGQLAANTAIADFARSSVDAIVALADGLITFARIFVGVAKTIAATAATANAALFSKPDQIIGNIKAIGNAYSEDILALLKGPSLSDQLAKVRAAGAAAGGQPAFSDARFAASRKPRLNFAGVAPPARGGGGRSSAGAAERQSEAERYIESLQKQFQGTLDLTEAEKVLAEIQGGRLAKATPGQIEQAKGIAAQIDASARLESQLKAEQEQLKEFEAERKRAAEESRRFVESIDAENQSLRDEIAIISGGEEARRAIEAARISSAIATREEAKALAELNGASLVALQNMDAEISKLKERQGLVGQRNAATDAAASLAEEQRNSERQLAAVKDPFTEQFASVIDGSKSAKSAFADFTKSVKSNLAQMAAESFADSLFGKKGSGGLLSELFGGGSTGGGGGLFGQAASWLGGLFGGFGGGKASGGWAAPNTLFEVGERRPEVFDDGSRQYLLTGSRGGKIDPNPKFGGGGRSMVVNNTFAISGPMSRRTQDQTAAAAARGVARANARMN